MIRHPASQGSRPRHICNAYRTKVDYLFETQSAEERDHWVTLVQQRILQAKLTLVDDCVSNPDKANWIPAYKTYWQDMQEDYGFLQPKTETIGGRSGSAVVTARGKDDEFGNNSLFTDHVVQLHQLVPPKSWWNLPTRDQYGLQKYRTRINA